MPAVIRERMDEPDDQVRKGRNLIISGLTRFVGKLDGRPVELRLTREFLELIKRI